MWAKGKRKGYTRDVTKSPWRKEEIEMLERWIQEHPDQEIFDKIKQFGKPLFVKKPAKVKYKYIDELQVEGRGSFSYTVYEEIESESKKDSSDDEVPLMQQAKKKRTS